MLPALVSEQFISQFRFYHRGTVCEGMSYRSKLYRLEQVFEENHRSKAFSYACALSHGKIETVVTKSNASYKVWVDLSASKMPCNRLLGQTVTGEGFPILKP